MATRYPNPLHSHTASSSPASSSFHGVSARVEPGRIRPCGRVAGVIASLPILAAPLLSLVVLLLAGASEAGTLSAPGKSPSAPCEPEYRTMVEHVHLDQIGIRFEPWTGARVRDGRLVSTTGADLSEVRGILAGIADARLAPRFARSERDLEGMREIGQDRTRTELPDLRLFARVDLPAAENAAAGRERLRLLLSALNNAPGVAEAWALPIASPSSLPGSHVSASKSAGRGGAGDPAWEEATANPASAHPAPAGPTGHGVSPQNLPEHRSDTPDFSPLQGYLHDSPVGVWADSAWTFAGGKGAGVKVLSLEWGWLFTHEDLKPPFHYGNDQGPSDHGTAVIGIVGGQHNGYGINGMAPDAEIGAIHLGDLAGGILEAISVLAPGDLYNMSIQVGGPESWMPTEWWPDCFAAIQTGAALGVICLEAAGNGSVNLDDPRYGDYFDRRVRDSGAIMAGAGTPNGLDGEWFTNHGERVSLQGWGSSVVTTCCGDLQGGDPEVLYTAGFNGTSSATPILSGTVASFQGQAKALFGSPLTPALMEEILSVTGTPYNGAKKIGERPNLAAARERLLRGFGHVTVTVRDGDTHEAMPGMAVEIVETGRIHVTGPEGQIRMQLSAGDLTFRVSGDFFYTVADFDFLVEQGGEQEAILDIYRTPHGSLAGSVVDQQGAPVAGARVLVVGAPIAPDTTAADGVYSIAGIPEDQGYLATASNVPGKGAAARWFDISGGGVTSWDPVLVDAFTFESSNGGYAPTGEWEWGTPVFPNGPNRPIPFSGAKCWGTDLDNAYDHLTTSILTSPVIDLSGSTKLTLTFHHWMWIAGDDGGQVQVWNADQNQWVVVHPVGGYPDDNVIILNYGPGYNGTRMTWEPAVFELDSYAGADFRFRFYFKTNFESNGIGWYIDDVAIDRGQGPSAVALAPSSEGPRILFAGPNPSAGASRIVFSIGDPTAVHGEVYDLRGAVVRRLAGGTFGPGTHHLMWDGLDEGGRKAASGLYLFRLRAGEQVRSARLLRIR